MYKVKISIIMGVFNCEVSLQDALDSLYNQTYKNFQIVMCDDGSIDNTYDIALKYVKKYTNIILLRNTKNEGLNYTLNRCLKFANTEYVARMDGDDISLPNRLEKEIDFLEKNKDFDIVSSCMACFDEYGVFKVTKPIEYPLNEDFVCGTPFSHPACMIRKKVLDTVGGYSVSPWLLRVEDYHLWFKLYSRGSRGYNIQDVLYKFRDDRNAYKRRNLRARINETYVMLIGFKMLKISWYKYVYSLKPLITYIMPSCIYRFIHRKSV